jgi:hypothetical protein
MSSLNWRSNSRARTSPRLGNEQFDNGWRFASNHCPVDKVNCVSGDLVPLVISRCDKGFGRNARERKALSSAAPGSMRSRWAAPGKRQSRPQSGAERVAEGYTERYSGMCRTLEHNQPRGRKADSLIETRHWCPPAAWKAAALAFRRNFQTNLLKV